MISATETNQKIVHYYTFGTKEDLSNLLMQLQIERMKIDKFMSKFLDKFERKMSYEETNTPVWDLYKKKSNEYSKLTQLINTAQYYFNKAHGNV